MTTTEKIYNLIAEHLGLDDPLAKNFDLRGDLNTSNEEMDDIFLTLEEEFAIETTKMERDQVKTIGDLVDLVKDKLDELEEE